MRGHPVSSTSGLGMSNGMELVSPANGNMNAYPYMNMANNDGSLYPMMPTMPGFPYTLVNNIDAIVPMFNNLEPITIPHAVLTPPLPGERRSRRPKPPGCRTVFVGNLPEKITEEIIRDAFKICGPISVVRMSKKNFCHIRFESMEFVDQALLLSGFRIKIDDSEDPAFNSRLHVDYAVAHDDQREYEFSKIARLREERRRERAFRSPSPPLIPNFSEPEAQTLNDKLCNKETFREGLQLLITWLDRGECNERNSGSFYLLIQSSYSHVKRLQNEKNKCKEETENAKENLINKNFTILIELNEIKKVFVATMTQKVWDHFTISQREKMEEMINDTYGVEDQQDFECIKRARLCEECHNQKEAIHPCLTLPIPHFSDSEAQTLADKLHNNETFQEGLQVLITWLDRGECNDRNSGSFYSMIQSSHKHMKRLQNEKNKCEEEVKKAKENLRNKSRSVDIEINEIEKVFVTAMTQKVWDHFTISQREKMKEMKNDTYEFKRTNSYDLVYKRVLEIELSDIKEIFANEN